MSIESVHKEVENYIKYHLLNDDENAFLNGLLTKLTIPEEISANPALLDKIVITDTLHYIQNWSTSPKIYNAVRNFSNYVRDYLQFSQYKMNLKEGEDNPNLSVYEKTLQERYMALRKSSAMDTTNPNMLPSQETLDKYHKNRVSSLGFERSFEAQAEKLYSLAQKNQDDWLEINLSGRTKGSAVHYLKLNKLTGTIDYKDAFHGSFSFQNKEDFVTAFRLMNMHQTHFSPLPPLSFYQVSKLTSEKPDQKMGFFEKATSFLNQFFNKHHWATNTVHGLSGAALGALGGAALGSILPLIGTAIGAIVGAALMGAVSAWTSYDAGNKGHHGLINLSQAFSLFTAYVRHDFQRFFQRRSRNTEPTIADIPMIGKGAQNESTITSSSSIIMNKINQTSTDCPTLKEKSGEKQGNIPEWQMTTEIDSSVENKGKGRVKEELLDLNQETNNTMKPS